MNEVMTLDPKELSVDSLHAYMLSAVAPRPIAFASTIDSDGSVNLSPFSFFNVFSSNPPIMIFSPARRGRDNTTKHTYENVKEVPEVVINIVNHAIVEQMSLSSTEYPKGVNEFHKSGLTQVESDLIKPPRVAESPAAFECRVTKVMELGTEGGAGNLVFCEVVKIHIQKQYLNDDQNLDTTKLDLVGRMGEMWYTRASGNALFEIPKPLRTQGIGIDALPKSIKESAILTGNMLARLGNTESAPSAAECTAYLNNSNNKLKALSKEQLHQHIQSALEQDNLQEALLLTYFSEYNL